MKNAERLAALLDGRLDARRRDELLAELAASEDEFDAYADAVAITAELEGATPEVTPIHTAPEVTPIDAAPSRRRGIAPRWLALAAVLAGVALAPWLWTRFAADRGLVAVEADALPPNWDASPWGVTRGAGDGLSDEARAVRLGARLVDVELAVRGRDPATAQLATQTAMLLEGIPFATDAVSIYRDIARRAGEPAESLEPLLKEGRKLVPQMADEERVKLGAWLESARIAAANRDRGFFASRANRSRLKRMAEDPSLPSSARSAAARIRIAVETAYDQDWGLLERELAGLLRSLGR